MYNRIPLWFFHDSIRGITVISRFLITLLFLFSDSIHDMTVIIFLLLGTVQNVRSVVSSNRTDADSSMSLRWNPLTSNGVVRFGGALLLQCGGNYVQMCFVCVRAAYNFVCNAVLVWKLWFRSWVVYSVLEVWSICCVEVHMTMFIRRAHRGIILLPLLHASMSFLIRSRECQCVYKLPAWFYFTE